MKTKRFINQTITLLLAAMLLMVAGVKTRSVNDQAAQAFSSQHTKASDKKDAPQTPESSQATFSSLSLDAVITPAISFDFFQYFYFLPQPAWDFIQRESVVQVAFRETFFLFSYFYRVFGSDIVTNAP